LIIKRLDIEENKNMIGIKKQPYNLRYDLVHTPEDESLDNRIEII